MNGVMKILRKRPCRISTCGLSVKNLNEREISSVDNYVPVYKFPYIRPLSLVNRMKFYQTVVSLTSIPAASLLSFLNYVDSEVVGVISALGASGCITLYSLGFLTSKFVGFIYYNEEKDMARLAYVDFWGRRKDIEIPAKDIIPIKELPGEPWDGLFLTLRRYSTKETLRLNLQFGIILDKEKIARIL